MVGSIGVAPECGGIASESRHPNSMERPTNMRTVVPSNARPSLRTTSAALLGAALLIAAAAAQAAPTITNAILETQINTLEPVSVTQSADPVAVSVAYEGSTLLSVAFEGEIAGIVGFEVDVTDPAAVPISGLQATIANGDADFLAGETGFGGQMPLVGVNKVCLFGECSAAIANLTVPVDVVGLGGVVFVTGAVNLTVIGAPWTSMTAAVGTVNIMGAEPAFVGTSMAPAWDVSLVTPVFTSTNIGASAVVPVFGVFSFTVAADAPEPATVAALGGAAVALIAVGVSRRKKS
jgi:hypothetical protein